MATLNISNFFTLTDIRGVARAGRQGAADDAASTPFQLTASTTPAITGTNHSRTGSIATATVNTIYNSTNDFPATWDFGFYVADQDTYLQLITSGTNFTVKVAAKVPIVIPGFGTLLAAANTTLITGGTEPTLVAINKVVVGNYSGSTAYYDLFLID